MKIYINIYIIYNIYVYINIYYIYIYVIYNMYNIYNIIYIYVAYNIEYNILKYILKSPCLAR